MKKVLKSFLCFAIAVVALFNLTACKTPLSDTTTDTKTEVNGVDTNGGAVLMHNGFLYFVNGTKSNDGKSATGNKRSAVYKAKVNSDGSIDSNYELVVDNLVGFNKGSIYIFGDFLYFTTPSDDVNFSNSKLNDQTKFMRYDLVNKKSYELYTTKQNSSSENISFAYYIVEGNLNLVVYEETAATIRSLKIGEKVTENYVIENVDSCVLSENYGTSLVENGVDANNFVFYTKTPTVGQYPHDGNYTFKTSPTVNNSVQISNDGKKISLLSIRNGKLIYSAKSISGNQDTVYFETIVEGEQQLSYENVVTYKTFINTLFMDNEDGSISIVTFNDDTNQIRIFSQSSNLDPEVGGELVNEINVSSSSSSSSSQTSSSSSSSSQTSKVSFVGTYTVDEEVKDAEVAEGEEKVTDKVTYLVYLESNTAYKIEIMRKKAGEENFTVSQFSEPVKLSKSTVSTADGTLVPEIIGNYLYAFAKEVEVNDNEKTEKENIYLFSFDLTITKNSTEYGTMLGVVED